MDEMRLLNQVLGFVLGFLVDGIGILAEFVIIAPAV